MILKSNITMQVRFQFRIKNRPALALRIREKRLKMSGSLQGLLDACSGLLDGWVVLLDFGGSFHGLLDIRGCLQSPLDVCSVLHGLLNVHASLHGQFSIQIAKKYPLVSSSHRGLECHMAGLGLIP
jgi:hypothetical protein